MRSGTVIHKTLVDPSKSSSSRRKITQRFSERLKRVVGHGDHVDSTACIGLRLTSKSLLAVFATPLIKIFTVKDGKVVDSIPPSVISPTPPSGKPSVSFTSATTVGPLVACGTSCGQLFTFDAVTRKFRYLAGFDESVAEVTAAQVNGRPVVLAASTSGSVMKYCVDDASGELRFYGPIPKPGKGRSKRCVAMTIHEDELWRGGTALHTKIHIQDLLRGEKRAKSFAFSRFTTGEVAALACHGHLVVAGRNAPDGGVYFINAQTKVKLGKDKEPSDVTHSGGVTCVAVKGPLAASGGADGVVRVWNGVLGTCVRGMAPLGSEVTSVSLSDNGRILLAGTQCGEVRYWDVEEDFVACTRSSTEMAASSSGAGAAGDAKHADGVRRGSAEAAGGERRASIGSDGHVAPASDAALAAAGRSVTRRRSSQSGTATAGGGPSAAPAPVSASSPAPAPAPASAVSEEPAFDPSKPTVSEQLHGLAVLPGYTTFDPFRIPNEFAGARGGAADHRGATYHAGTSGSGGARGGPMGRDGTPPSEAALLGAVLGDGRRASRTPSPRHDSAVVRSGGAEDVRGGSVGSSGSRSTPPAADRWGLVGKGSADAGGRGGGSGGGSGGAGAGFSGAMVASGDAGRRGSGDGGPPSGGGDTVSSRFFKHSAPLPDSAAFDVYADPAVRTRDSTEEMRKRTVGGGGAGGTGTMAAHSPKSRIADTVMGAVAAVAGGGSATTTAAGIAPVVPRMSVENASPTAGPTHGSRGGAGGASGSWGVGGAVGGGGGGSGATTMYAGSALGGSGGGSGLRASTTYGTDRRSSFGGGTPPGAAPRLDPTHLRAPERSFGAASGSGRSSPRGDAVHSPNFIAEMMKRENDGDIDKLLDGL